MCDYSLDFVASRPAKVGDKLISTRFDNSITRGFAAVGEPNVAVCVLPGTEIAFEQEVEYRHALFVCANIASSLSSFVCVVSSRANLAARSLWLMIG